MTNLLIVESPAKCKKIQGFLGAGWRVQATMGHIRSLQEDLKAIGFDPTKKADQVWKPTYENIAAKRDAIASLRKAAAGATVYLGADDDREGEAIAWHTCILLGLDPATTPRVTFHEITESAIKQAVATPSRIDMNKFNAQQARTMLDMLIGFTLSPCLWRSVGFKAGLSAGRCQTPALRIIYDRDVAIEAHVAAFSWSIKATTENGLQWTSTSPCKSEEEATTILKELAAQPKPKTLTITDRVERISTSQPPKPFITSSLQQEASSRLSMNPKVTMRAAQTLYEAGHITYMRTDNAILSQEAIDAASAVVTARWGATYLAPVASSTEAPKKTVKVVKKKATEAASPAAPQASVAPQQAHEGIRPTHMDVESVEEMSAQEQRLYKLIWTRTLQSVMAPESRDVVKATAVPSGKPDLLTLQAEWTQTRFAGWRILDAERKAEEETGDKEIYESFKTLVKDHMLLWSVFNATEVRTSAKSRYTEASLIQELEHKGIGRPSTYATLVETVLDRGYVEKATIAATPVTVKGLELKAAAKEPKATTKTEKAGGEKDKLRTTPLGRTVIEWLLSQFGDILTYDFTAGMEAKLDDVASGSKPWSAVLQETWSQYADRYATIMTASPSAPSASSPSSSPSSSSASGGTGTPRNSANKSDFGDGYKMVVSKKGPLFVLEVEGQKTRFANVPAHLSIQTATKEDAIAAFASTTAATAGESLGDLEGSPVIRKRGPYGVYVTWSYTAGTINVNCKAEETMTEIGPRLLAKATPAADAVDHQIGPYKIKRGPYGLYMFKTGTTKKPTFVSIPETTPWATMSVESADAVYKHCSSIKKEAKKTPK
jgi:DNA topoisomerase-1